ncbi:MAG: GNAT family N-acetyltransferase [Hyphomicrobium sp.]
MEKLEYDLRSFVPADTAILRDLLAASFEELTQADYTEEERVAWVSIAEDSNAFCKLLEQGMTLVVEVNGDPVGFASLKENHILNMLYVHPYHVDEGIGTMLCDALESFARIQGQTEILVESSETAVLFFEKRGYLSLQRNSAERYGEWLTTTTLKKVLNQ